MVICLAEREIPCAWPMMTLPFLTYELWGIRIAVGNSFGHTRFLMRLGVYSKESGTATHLDIANRT